MIPAALTAGGEPLKINREDDQHGQNYHEMTRR